MASQNSQQYAYRAQKTLGLVGGTPDYLPIPGFEAPDSPARTHHYSQDGRLYAYALPTVVRIFQAEGAQLLRELAIPNVIELEFSPRGTYLSTWERPLKLEDGTQHKNLRVFSTSTGEELVSFSQKLQERWNLQFTISESNAVRLVGPDIQVFSCAEWSKGVVDKLKVEGATSVSLSPGSKPSIAVFVAEKNGSPASIKIHSLDKLDGPPTCQKTFFKADRSQIKWNKSGTHLLLLTQTEVDNSNKSYYGETGMYLLNASGGFDCRVTLDKEGPIHDFAWSPNSKEFGVVYGYMPAKTMLFDQRVRTLHDFNSSPHNFISFNPQGRLIALAGFGNLAGKIDVMDRRTLTKVCTIDAPNTSHCEWSPDGQFLLTATLSPRLRVDNGIKIWHCTGPLVHIQTADELYHASWQPIPVEAVTPFGATLPAAPHPSESVRNDAEVLKKLTPQKAAGAYRPPGARGLATPAFFKREDEGGEPRMPTNGTATPPRTYNRGSGNGNGTATQSGGRRHVPGAAPPASEGEKKGARKRKSGKERKDGGSGPVEKAESGEPVMNGHEPSVEDEVAVPPLTPIGPEGALDATAKKIRNLTKKLKAIEELKEKAKRGERLEATQLKKMDGEGDIRKELASLEAL